MSQHDPLDRPNNPEDKLGILLTIVSFIIPIVGAILYFVYKAETPNKARTACYAALAGVVFGIVMQVIMTVVVGASS